MDSKNEYIPRRTIQVSILSEKPDDDWNGWDEESFKLREQLLYKLLDVYNINYLKQELDECQWLLNKKKFFKE